LSADKLDDKPDNNKPNNINNKPRDVNCNRDVLSGGYNVQPIPIPNSEDIDNIMMTYE